MNLEKMLKLPKLYSNCVTSRDMVLICQFSKQPKIFKHVTKIFCFSKYHNRNNLHLKSGNFMVYAH